MSEMPTVIVVASGAAAGWAEPSWAYVAEAPGSLGATLSRVMSAGFPLVVVTTKAQAAEACDHVASRDVLVVATPQLGRCLKKALTGGQETLTPQLVGTLAPNEKSGDDNRPVGFEIHGHVSPDTPGDVDVYSFKGIAGSEVWIDLNSPRTSTGAAGIMSNISN